MIEIIAILAALWLAYRHISDTVNRLRHSRIVPLKESRYRRALRRMTQRRYIRGARTRQQVRALEHLAWQMRGRIGKEPSGVHFMCGACIVEVVPQIWLEQPTITKSEWEAQNKFPKNSLAYLVSRPKAFLPEQNKTC